MTQHRLYGLIGHPVGHSFSAGWFSRLFDSEGIDAEYRNFDLGTISDLSDIIANEPDLCGFNVTSPYKRRVMACLSAVDPVAARVGAVNTVVVHRDAAGRPVLVGYNTDVGGFVDSLVPLLRPDIDRALVLGSGGASAAVVDGLDQLGIGATVVSRTPRSGQLAYSALTSGVMRQHLLVVNATPLGMMPLQDQCPSIPYHAMTPAHVAFDLIYNPPNTLFMQRAAAAGATVVNGLDMLIGQARRAWQIWQASSPP